MSDLISSCTVGIALLCTREGAVERVIHDGLGAAERIRPGRSYLTLLDGGSVVKAMAFLEAVQSQGAAFGWELNVRLGGEVTTLHFAGGALDGRILIVAARSRNGAAKLYDELLSTNNERANALRAALKAEVLRTLPTGEHDTDAYDELARINNELATLQRELAKKNHELEQAVADLQSALAQVKQLSGLLPICASCKKIRDDQGYWQQVDVYVRDRSEADFTHGICPDCMARLYPDLDA